MATPLGRSSLGPSLPPPSPKSPPKYPDLHGKRREIARLHMLEKEISVLQDELRFTEGLQPASTSCKELIDFVVANADPLIPTNNKKHRLYRRFWKWLCRMPSLNLCWICCYCCDRFNLQLKLPRRCCRCCNLCNCTCLPSSSSSSCNICVLPKWRCFSCPKSNCFNKKHSCCRCRQNCCIIPRCCKFDCPSSPSCCTCKCSCSCSCPSCPVESSCCCCFMSRSCWENCYCTCTCPRMTVC